MMSTRPLRVLWCWRRKAEVPALDEGEFASIAELYRQAFSASKEYRRRWGIPLEHATLNERFLPVRLRYEQLTGMKECHENAVMHHRLSLYSERCELCGKTSSHSIGEILWRMYAPDIIEPARVTQPSSKLR